MMILNILASMLAAILDSGDRITDCNTNFSNGFTALDNPYKMVLGNSLVHLD